MCRTVAGLVPGFFVVWGLLRCSVILFIRVIGLCIIICLIVQEKII